MSTMHNNAIKNSAAYAEAHMQNAMAFEDKKALWDYVLGSLHEKAFTPSSGCGKAEARRPQCMTTPSKTRPFC